MKTKGEKETAKIFKKNNLNKAMKNRLSYYSDGIIHYLEGRINAYAKKTIAFKS